MEKAILVIWNGDNDFLEKLNRELTDGWKVKMVSPLFTSSRAIVILEKP